MHLLMAVRLMINGTPQALTIAGTDSSGGAGISADLKTFMAQGVYGGNVIVSVTAQNTRGVQQVQMIPPAIITQQIQSIADDLSIAAVKTGMLGDAQTVNTVAKALQTYNFGSYILDPVMVAKGGAKLLRDEAILALKTQLLPLATMVTPNIPEAEVLTEMTIQTHEDVKIAAYKLQLLGAKNVLLKGGHGSEIAVYDFALLADGSHFWLKSQRVDTERTHGTGDTLSAAIAAQLTLGFDMKTAIIKGKAYVDATIRDGIQVGHGHGPLNHLAVITKENQPEVINDI